MNSTDKCRIVRSYLPYTIDVRSGRVYVSSSPLGHIDVENTISVELDVIYKSLYTQIWNYVFDDQ